MLPGLYKEGGGGAKVGGSAQVGSEGQIHQGLRLQHGRGLAGSGQPLPLRGQSLCPLGNALLLGSSS